ncbi:DUF2333 family protein [Methylomonas sp. MED-D]|uniref:DUF2333 domain-containing protein n=1 Tax=Methylomonas koyamae TaxID=702114 RepID=A0A177NX66_9GAMM|nr:MULTISPECIES: DUF2333 family protein [Methylomonas]NJA05912.1 DUF2333 family protein [Methylococcaceae bacterium WWC4]MDT4330534.1 DUF2333 family protein [Methylomonas sp. MV1]OAI22432.1 hypothetical protein A1355_02140 [Methylomonas koyamae]OHX34839.1 hypothetical protein BJL95_12220 [Methylomonas sp. LWB]WGS86336.1 DUF2333 family protein [Methylomonas sp. UP202]
MSDNPLAYEDSKSRGILWGFGSLVSVVVIVMLVLGEWWSQEPEQFSVEDEAIERMNVTHTDQMPIGYVYANTLAHIADVILFKAGGYLSNDVAPPGLFCDNIQSFEYGALVMLRDGTTALRNHFARDQSQSAEDPDLAKAEPYFYYERNSWALPSTESEYVKGVEALHGYMARLQNPTSESKPAQFHARADNLWQYTEVVIKRLGGLSTRLAASTDRFSGAAHGDPSNPVDMNMPTIGQTPWLEIDNVFYEARGASWALLHILRAIKHDFSDILLDKRAMNTLDIMIQSLEKALTPTLSPVVLNGDGFGLFANYSLALANYIARANAAALDLRDVMNRG